APRAERGHAAPWRHVEERVAAPRPELPRPEQTRQDREACEHDPAHAPPSSARRDSSRIASQSAWRRAAAGGAPQSRGAGSSTPKLALMRPGRAVMTTMRWDSRIASWRLWVTKT